MGAPTDIDSYTHTQTVTVIYRNTHINMKTQSYIQTQLQLLICIISQIHTYINSDS